MFKSVVLLCAVVVLVKGETTAVQRCTRNSGALPVNTYIEGCVDTPCLLPQLQDAVINIIFKAPRTLRSMTTLATAYLGIIPINYPLQENAVTCNFLTNTYCPVLAEEIVKYQLNMFIEPTFPVGTSVPIEFRIVDENNSPVVCIRVPIRIVEAVENKQASNDNAILS